MQTDLYREYALVDLEFKKLEAKKEELRGRILQGMISENHEKVDTDFGAFTVAHKVVWTYSDKVKGLEEKVKISKLNEQKKGKAKPVEKPYLMFSDKKLS